MDPALYPSDQRFNPKYGTPIIQGPPIQNQPIQGPTPQVVPAPVGPYPDVMMNQPIPVIAVQTAIINPLMFRTEPVAIQCPFCFNYITTKVETTCSLGACCLCCFTGFLVFACIQLCNNKNVCCCDATHFCPICGKQLGFYSAM